MPSVQSSTGKPSAHKLSTSKKILNQTELDFIRHQEHRTKKLLYKPKIAYETEEVLKMHKKLKFGEHDVYFPFEPYQI